MKKVMFFVVLGSVFNPCYSAAPHDELKQSGEVAIQQHREILGACILYLRALTKADSLKVWAEGEIKMITQIDPTKRTLVMRPQGSLSDDSFTYTFKYLTDSQLRGMEEVIKSLRKTLDDREIPLYWYKLCENAGVPKEQQTPQGTMAFLESCKE